ncbi:DUF4142 domain-containing protein [Streptacidiphilus griseoplanus]|uniref:DUF4142 domain-containing protein n=1 Tax=Peterkaempfera griseoplana TaxID=66896 RepID=UPI0006E462B4|nr:DUF4142 domain-containing protein [Peterkaempfera griseoplana]
MRPSDRSSTSPRQARPRGGPAQSRLLRMLAVGLVAVIVPLWVYKQGGGSTPVAAQTVASDGLPAGTINTAFGPLTPDERVFVTKVRLAGLWELPSGMMAQTHTTNPLVHEAGKHLLDGHRKLDEQTLKIAAQLGMGLPNQPSDQQMGFLQQEQAAQGPAFDQTFAQLLRVQHGLIFQSIAKIRNSTRNTLVRQLADSANNTVLDHITVLERTGVVDFNQVASIATQPPASSALPPGVAVGQALPVTQLANAWARTSGAVNSGTAAGTTGAAGTAGTTGAGGSAGAVQNTQQQVGGGVSIGQGVGSGTGTTAGY